MQRLILDFEKVCFTTYHEAACVFIYDQTKNYLRDTSCFGKEEQFIKDMQNDVLPAVKLALLNNVDILMNYKIEVGTDGQGAPPCLLFKLRDPGKQLSEKEINELATLLPEIVKQHNKKLYVTMPSVATSPHSLHATTQQDTAKDEGNRNTSHRRARRV